MNKHQSGFAHVVITIIVGVLIMGGAAYFGARNFPKTVNDPSASKQTFSPGPIPTLPDADTSTWKTYTNEKYGFEFKYPIESMVVDGINISVNAGDKGLDNILEISVIDRAPTNFHSMGTNSSFAGFPAYSFEERGDRPATGLQPVRVQILRFVRDGVGFEIEYRLDWYDGQAERILATFKFIDQKSSTDTSGWKTYRNEKYGFEFKYPEDKISISDVLQGREGVLLSDKVSGIVLGGINVDEDDFSTWEIVKEPSNLIVAGKQTKVEYRSPPKSMADRRDYSVVKVPSDNKYSYVLIFASEDSFRENFLSFLSTFKFIDQKSSTDTSGWKTHRNEKYGFEFKYPPDWKMSQSGFLDPPGREPVERFVTVGNPLQGLTFFEMRFFVTANLDRLTAETYAKRVMEASRRQLESTGVGVDLSEYKNYPVTISGMVGYKIEDVFQFDHHADIIFLANDIHAYRVTFPVAKENPNLSNPIENNVLARQILSTFKLLPPIILDGGDCC